MPSLAIALSTAIEPILAALAGTMPCQPSPPWGMPGTSWSLRGRMVPSSRSPGIRMPWNCTGLNSMIRPDQLISQPITPVKIGMDTNANQSRSFAHSLSQSIRGD